MIETFFLRRLGAVLLGGLCLLATPAIAVECAICETEDPTELFEISGQIDSNALRHQIRGWLAENRPDTAAGYAARAWVNNVNGGAEETSADLYSEALQMDPNLSIAAINMANLLQASLSEDELLALLGDYFDTNSLAMWNAFYSIYDNHDKDRALAYLARWEKDGTGFAWVPVSIRASLAETAGDLGQAEALATQALDMSGESSDSYDLDAFERWLNIRKQRLRRDGAGSAALQETFDQGMEYAAATRTPMAYNLLCAFAESEMRDVRARMQSSAAGLSVLPLPELAECAFWANINYRPATAHQAIEMAQDGFGDNYLVLSLQMEENNLTDMDGALLRRLTAEALDAAPTSTSRLKVGDVILYSQTIQRDFDAGPAVMAEIASGMTESDRRSLLGKYYENRLAARDLDRAETAVNQMEELGAAAGYVAERRERVISNRALFAERSAFLDSQPFLRDWETRFGDSLRASVEFETARATIRPESYGLLRNAGAALTAPGGEDYIFQIEGHTDNRGKDSLNFPLSEARAASVKDYFVSELGLDSARIQIRGYGPRNPIAPNATDAGRQSNRRVEIRPLGNITAPQVATPGAYRTRGMVLSADGRIAVMGNSPTQIWDMQRDVVLHEIAAGYGHAISPNGRYLASTSAFRTTSGSVTNALYLYDLRSGTLIDLLPNDVEMNYFSWSPFSDKIVINDLNGFVRIYDMSERRVTQTTRIMTVRGTGPILWTKDGREIAVKAPENRAGIFILDAATLKVKTVLDDEIWLHALGQSSDGRYVISSRNDYGSVIYDTTDNWNAVHRETLPLIAREIYSHPVKQQVIMRAKFDTDIKILSLDLASGRVLATSELDIDGGGFSPDGEHFLATSGGHIIELDPETLRPVTERFGRSETGKSVALIEDAGLVLTSDAGGSAVWSLETGRRVHSFDSVPNGGWAPLTDRPWQFVTITEKTQLVLFDSRNFSTQTIWSSTDEISHVVPTQDGLVVATIPAQSSNRGSAEPQGTIRVLADQTWQERQTIKLPLVTGALSYGKAFNYGLTLSVSGGIVAARSAYSDGFGHAQSNSSLVRLYDLANGKEVQRISRPRAIQSFSLRNDGAEMRLRTQSWYEVINVASGERTSYEDYDPRYTIKLEDGRTVRWFWDRIELDGKTLNFPQSLHQLKASKKLNVLVGQTSTGKILLIDLKRLQVVLTIVPFSNSEWIAYTPEGTYTASLNGTDGVYWSLGDNYLPFEALAQRFEKPNLVRDLLTKMAQGTLSDEDIKKTEVEPEIFDAPYRIKLTSALASKTAEDSFTLRMEIRKDRPDLPDPEFVYRLNGREVLRSRGFEEEAFVDTEEEQEVVTVSRRFALRPGNNVIEASLKWQGAQVSTQRIVVQREGGQSQALSDRKLWFFGVGVSDYADPSQNLNFADADATALADLLEKQKGTLFADVQTRVLTNADAVERNVRIEMNEFLAQAAPDDVVIVFIAGHGVTDEDQQLYFMTHDADLKRPYTGMSVDRFRQYLEDRPLNQSALLLLDICHAGAANRVVSEDAVQALSAGTGAIVFASSSGSEVSFEDERFGGGHGAFTAALLEALRGMADTDTGNRDGVNSLQEMVIYTSAQVPRLTEGQQRPALPAMARDVDYPISRTAN